MPPRKEDKPVPLPVYESHPPPWLPNAHETADLGFVGFHPPRMGQDEDVLSENHVKNGFVLGLQVPAETFSAQTIINENLHAKDSLTKLETLMNEVFIRRAERIPAIPPSNFRIPTRVTLNDAKRQAWFADLANPEVPLHKLGKSVPHGAKGHDLLDLLQSNNVAIDRALWFLRVFGANETAGLRNKPTYNPTQYSIEWANVVTGYLKKQLNDIALPSAPRPGLNIKQTFKGVLADVDSRERWISRFTYCLKLLRTFYSEGLIDHRTFLVWLVQQMGSCNLAQAGFITRLTDEYMDDILSSRALTRTLVESCLGKLAEIRCTSAQETLHDTEKLLKILVQRMCLALPDAFVSPRMWTSHMSLIEAVIAENNMDHANDRHIGHNIRDIQQLLLENLIDVKKRNEAMLFLHPPSQENVRLGSCVSDVKLLNSISNDTDMHSVFYFNKDLEENSPAFKEKLDMLLTWSVTPLQYGVHRPFAAITLIRIWRDKACDRANRRDYSTPMNILQDQLFEWLDTSDVAGEPSNIKGVSLLYGRLIQHELFSYASYIQRLIARGEPGLSYTEGYESRHRRFLTWIPLLKPAASLSNQRKVTLHGVRARETPEDVTEREIRKEIRAILPELFGGVGMPCPTSTSALLEACKTLTSATRFEQCRTFKLWLLPIIQKQMTGLEQPSLHRVYCISVELMTYAKCFRTILDMTLFMFDVCTSFEFLIGIIDTLRRFSTIWTCMDAMSEIVAALDAAHQLWKIRGVQSRSLLILVLEFDNGRYLDDTSRERIAADIVTFSHALRPLVENHEPVPDVLPEILLLANDPVSDAPSILANSLWIKYRSTHDWAWKVWDNTVASLRQVPVMTHEVLERKTYALRYATFLLHIDQHLPHGLNGDILQWFIGRGKNEVAALTSDVWDVLTVVLLHLVVHGAIETTSILSGLVYTAWQSGAPNATESPGRVSETFLRSANKLFYCLLLQDDGMADAIPPTKLFDIQCIRTRRKAVYCNPHFTSLIESISLLISLENNENIPLDIRTETTNLRQRLCENREFRQGAYRYLDVIRDVFESTPYLIDSSSEAIGKRAIAGLRMIFGDSADDTELYDWPDVTCLLSPWKIAATTIQTQFIIKQQSRALAQEPQNTASDSLDKLMLTLLHHTTTSDEAIYVGEMAQRVDDIVAGKFINNGLKCITEILSGKVSKTDCLKRVGELLCVLVYAAQPYRDEACQLPQIDASVHEDCALTLHTKISGVESALISDSSPENSLIIKQEIILLARLLQYVLGFRCAWSQRLKGASVLLASCLFRLALHFASGDNLDLLLYPLLIDTLLYVYDEIPPDSKTLPADPFCHYPDIPLSDLSMDLPLEYRNQLISLISHFPTNHSVANLVNSSRDHKGNLIHGSAVLNRPWEWIENLGEPSVLEPKEEEREREEKIKIKYRVKNSGSLSLETFDARLTGDGIIRDITSNFSSRTGGDIRTFEDCLSSEGIYARDWRETRVDLKSEVLPTSNLRLKGDLEADLSATPTLGFIKSERRLTPRGSPVSSVISRSSALGPTSGRPQSPAQASNNSRSNSIISEVIDVDSITSITSMKGSSKRKAATALSNISDEEVEFVEGPAVRLSNKRSKTKAPAKTRAKKK